MRQIVLHEPERRSGQARPAANSLITCPRHTTQPGGTDTSLAPSAQTAYAFWNLQYDTPFDCMIRAKSV
jgi:hypothetical protein